MTSANQTEGPQQMAQDTGGHRPAGIVRLLPTLVPIALLALALILPHYMFSRAQSPTAIGLGPAAWPDGMLDALAFFALLWLLRDIWALVVGDRAPTLTPPVEDEPYDMTKALIGLVMIVAYGWLLPIVGFAVASCVFIALWCIIGGLRNPVVVVPVTLIGTVALLWLFMGLALMPLPRGAGMFGNFSLWLLRTTGIY